MEIWLVILGVLLILEGVPWFLSPARLRSLLADLARLPDPLLRTLGLAMMAGGLLLVWLGRR